VGKNKNANARLVTISLGKDAGNINSKTKPKNTGLGELYKLKNRMVRGDKENPETIKNTINTDRPAAKPITKLFIEAKKAFPSRSGSAAN
tara:strand:- start:79 stop:348 length:270 start_codon:yes stop_codon:yes gene_type:complete